MLSNINYKLRTWVLNRMLKKGEPSFSLEYYDVIPRGEYDYIPKGKSVFGDTSDFLLIPKNRYRAVLLPEQTKSAEKGIGWITEDNSSEGYDQLWGDELNLQAFRAEADGVRDKLTQEIVDCIESEIPDNASIVDIGCGVGDLLADIRRRKPNVTISGLDFSNKAVDKARNSFPDGQFTRYIIELSLPYESNLFDVVTCTDVLEHLEYPRVIAAELVRICRPGGTVAIVVPDGDVDQFLGHYWFWNENTLKEMLAEWNPVVKRLPETREFIAIIKNGALENNQ